MVAITPAQATPSPLAAAFRSCRTALVTVALFSGVINLLTLTGPLFMLQIYDRVLASKSVPTLLALLILVGMLFIFFGLFEVIRSRMLVRVARQIDKRVNAALFAAVIDHTVKRSPHAQAQPLRDLEMMRQYLSGTSLGTLFDLPWTPLCLGVIFLLHPYLGLFALCGIAVLVLLVFLNDWLSRALFRQSSESAVVAHRVAEESRRNAAAIHAMGMMPAMRGRWLAVYNRALEDHVTASDRNGALFAFAKMIRLALQSAILALGAYLAIQQEISPGTIVAASIILTRAAAPIEQGISQWRGFMQFQAAARRLDALFADLGQRSAKMALPAPKGRLKVEGLTVVAPGRGKAGTVKTILRNIHFALEPGQALGIIGPTGAGKSTLARALVNVWEPAAGAVSMDGAPYDQWDAGTLGAGLGYLPQEVELFDGAFDENIARFDAGAPPEAVIDAARLAGVHDLILSFPEGYKTRIGEAGVMLSGGQRQRIGLARALYGDPVLVVMDEPNANLDMAGEAALAHAMRVLKQKGVTVVVVAHRPSAIAAADLLIYLKDGRQVEFGPKDEVLRKVSEIADTGRDIAARRLA